jgi:hypothetical protein
MNRGWRYVLLAAGVCGCAHLGIHRRQTGLDDAVAQARMMAGAGQFRDADRALSRFAAEHATEPAAVDATYWRAVLILSPSNQSRSIDTALTLLDAYLAAPKPLAHLDEAMALRDLAADAQGLAKVQAALRQARAANADQGNSDTRTGEEATKEVQRLRDELAAANAELERIRKRLANPKPPT